MVNERRPPKQSVMFTDAQEEQEHETSQGPGPQGGRRRTLDPRLSETPSAKDYESVKALKEKKDLDSWTEEEFTQLIRVFTVIAENEDTYETVIRNTRQENLEYLQELNEAHNDQVRELIEERNAYEQEKNNLENTLRNRPQAPVKSAIKIPDPPLLNKRDQEPQFELWSTQIRDKLHINADLFQTEQARMGYVFNRTTGEAQGHLFSRYRPSAKNAYQTAQEMIEHLRTIYEDPYQRENARYTFGKFYMKKSQPFIEFYSEFLRLANRAEIEEDRYAEELFLRVSYDLQLAISPLRQTFKTYQELANRLTAIDQDATRIKERKERFDKKKDPYGRPITKTTTPTSSPASTANPPGTQVTVQRTRPTYDNPERKQLSLEGKCFYCKATGHMARECPAKSSVREITEDQQVTEQGKDSA
jgi:hypothetical protein